MSLRTASLLILAALGALPASAQRLADYAQLDGSADSSSLVLVRALGDPRAATPAPLLTASASHWTDGRSLALALVPRWTIAAGGGHALRAGAGAGAEHFEDRAGDERRSDASLRLQAEADGPLAAHRYYLLAQASSFRRGAFVTAQLALAGTPLALELSRVTDRGYGASTGVVRWRVDGGWWLRLGAVRDDAGTRALVGVAYNGF